MVALRLRHQDAFDLVSLFGYVWLIYGWWLGTHPMGRDYGILASSGADYPVLTRLALRALVAWFGSWAPGYHLVNVLILYACMALIYALAKYAVRGMWWLGTWAACIFMANPVHTEAVLNVTGVVDLLPCVIGLIVLLGYADHAAEPAGWKLPIHLSAFALGVAYYPELAPLVIVLWLYEWLIVPAPDRSRVRIALWSAVGLAAIAYHRMRLPVDLATAADQFAPLYLILYPIGFLPETIEKFHARPWTGLVAGATVVAVFTLIYRKARRPAILFGALGAVVLRSAVGGKPIDLVHMVGGGQLLLANALLTLAVAALVFRIMDHPKWRPAMVGITTTIALLCFAMQTLSNKTWSDSGKRVAEFQEEVRDAAESGVHVVGIVPDYQFCRGAPMCFSESIAHDTPFSRSVRYVSLLPIHSERKEGATARRVEWSSHGGMVRVEGESVTPGKTFRRPWLLRQPGDQRLVSDLLCLGRPGEVDATVRLRMVEPDHFEIGIESSRPLPERIVPLSPTAENVPSARKESG